MQSRSVLNDNYSYYITAEIWTDSAPFQVLISFVWLFSSFSSFPTFHHKTIISQSIEIRKGPSLLKNHVLGNVREPASWLHTHVDRFMDIVIKSLWLIIAFFLQGMSILYRVYERIYLCECICICMFVFACVRMCACSSVDFRFLFWFFNLYLRIEDGFWFLMLEKKQPSFFFPETPKSKSNKK